jgi:hypothetical protein
MRILEPVRTDAHVRTGHEPRRSGGTLEHRQPRIADRRPGRANFGDPFADPMALLPGYAGSLLLPQCPNLRATG